MMKDLFFDILPFLCTGIALVLLFRPRRDSTPPASNPTPTPTPTPTPAPQSLPVSTGPIVYFATNDFGLPDREYRFDYRKEGASWRAYIVKMPSLRGRSSSFHITHRLGTPAEPFVCWDQALKNLEDAQTVSRVWADNLQEYIATGKRF